MTLTNKEIAQGVAKQVFFPAQTQKAFAVQLFVEKFALSEDQGEYTQETLERAIENSLELYTMVLKAEYEEMTERLEFLSCLEACGVDNWEGYSDAGQMMEEEE